MIFFLHEIAERYLASDLEDNFPRVVENAIDKLFERSTYYLAKLNKSQIKDYIIINAKENKTIIPFEKLSFDNSRESVMKIKIDSNINTKMRIIEKKR